MMFVLVTTMLVAEEKKEESKGPFGLKMGMTLEEVTEALKEQAPKGLEKDSTFEHGYRCKPKYLPFDMEIMRVRIHPKHGLFFLAVGTDILEIYGTGDPLTKISAKISDTLFKKYGQPSIAVDALKPGTKWNKPTDWTMSVLTGDRILAMKWFAPLPKEERGALTVFSEALVKDNILLVAVETMVFNDHQGGAMVIYHFDNEKIILKEEEEKKLDF
jgi:hypothetical protein